MKRRRVLLLLAATLVVADAVWLAHFTQPPAADLVPAKSADRLEFVLDVSGSAADEFIHGNPLPLPLYDRASGQFTFDGEPIADFARFMSGLELGPHGSMPFILVALPQDATIQDYTAALLPLVDQGICRVGVYEPFPAEELRPADRYRPSWPGKHMTAALLVRELRPHPGVVRTCRDRSPPWSG